MEESRSDHYPIDTTVDNEAERVSAKREGRWACEKVDWEEEISE